MSEQSLTSANGLFLRGVFPHN